MMFKEMLALMLVGTAAALSLSLTEPSAYSQTPANADAREMSEFTGRVAAYVALHKKLAGTLPTLPEKATPEQIHAHQVALEKLLTTARSTAKKGDVFGPAMTGLVRKLLLPVFKGPGGDDIRRAIHDEPHPVQPVVNKRYPDEVPLSTMPTDVLKMLPKLDETLEYRFIGRHLILLDVPAHLIVDVVDNAMPA
jgi:hypothetical protein